MPMSSRKFSSTRRKRASTAIWMARVSRSCWRSWKISRWLSMVVRMMRLPLSSLTLDWPRSQSSGRPTVSRMRSLICWMSSERPGWSVVGVAPVVAEEAAAAAASAAAAAARAGLRIGQGASEVELGSFLEVGHPHEQVADVVLTDAGFGAEVVLRRDTDHALIDGEADGSDVAHRRGGLLQREAEHLRRGSALQVDGDGRVLLDARGFEGGPVDEDVHAGGEADEVDHRHEALIVEVDRDPLLEPIEGTRRLASVSPPVSWRPRRRISVSSGQISGYSTKSSIACLGGIVASRLSSCRSSRPRHARGGDSRARTARMAFSVASFMNWAARLFSSMNST